MNFKNRNRSARTDMLTYLGVTVAFIILTVLKSTGGLNRSQSGLLVPICCYIVMAVSLNLTAS